jgi:hypothetical protein
MLGTPIGPLRRKRGQAFADGKLLAGINFLVPVRGFDTYCNETFPVKLGFETALKIAS